jgi:YD repeat-containing protein
VLFRSPSNAASLFGGFRGRSFFKKLLWGVPSSYLELCNLAAINDTAFAHFRLNPYYMKVLEHVTREQGAECIREIGKAGIIDLEKHRSLIAENDYDGNPVTYEYDGLGALSATTARYVKVASDIMDFFSLNRDSEPVSVVEIGVGYGGQCRLLTEFLNVKSYTLVDISPALRLAKRYLEGFAIKATLKFLTMNEIDRLDCDLCVSNYAFSELNKPLQDTYRVEEFAKMILRKTEILEEKPLTHPLNKVLIWRNV